MDRDRTEKVCSACDTDLMEEEVTGLFYCPNEECSVQYRYQPEWYGLEFDEEGRLKVENLPADTHFEFHDVALEVHLGETRRVVHRLCINGSMLRLDPEIAARVLLERAKDDTEAFFREMVPRA